VSETAQIIDVLKRTLKTRGLTYRDLARRVGLSEGSIKRVFAAETFTLQRLEGICTAIGISMGELMRAAANSHEAGSQYLSLEQEQLLAADSRLLACFYLLLNGRSSAEIVQRMDLAERGLRELYVKLDDAGLIELQPRLKARLRVGPVVGWRIDGPVHRVYERQVWCARSSSWRATSRSWQRWTWVCPRPRRKTSRCWRPSGRGCPRCSRRSSRGRRSECFSASRRLRVECPHPSSHAARHARQS
jgi:transcriptional regulator with XRE-family HTH domain